MQAVRRRGGGGQQGPETEAIEEVNGGANGGLRSDVQAKIY